MRAKQILRRSSLFFVLLVFGVLTASQSRSQPVPIHHGEVIPASVAVFFGGPGSGKVDMRLGIIGIATECTSDCTKKMGAIGAPMKITFAAAPQQDSLFAGWGGDCSGTGTTCTLDLAASIRVIAYFRSAFRTVAAGGSHTCVLAPGGTITCWGRNGDAELGLGNTSLSQGPVVGIANAVAIAAGDAHTCALLADGTVSCWGANAYGQTGGFTYSFIDQTTPTSVRGLGDVVALTAGGFHTCVIVAGGTASCWGANNHGQLGDGTNHDSDSPVPVNLAVVGPLSRIAAGGYHTCGIIAATARAVCWGADNVGELGNATRVDMVMPIVPVVAGGNPGCPGSFNLGCANPQLPITPLTPVTAIAASSGGGQEFHSVALDASGQDWGWGNNNEGEINMGIGGEQDAAQRGVNPTPPTVMPQMIAAGAFHTCMASWIDGVLCRGDNRFGQAGPTPNSAAHTSAVPTTTGAIGLAAGAYHTCAVVKGFVFPSGPPGTVLCWGNNDNGQVTGTPSPGSNVTAAFVITFLPP